VDAITTAPLTADDSFLLIDRLRDLRRRRSAGLIDDRGFRAELGGLLERRHEHRPVPSERRG
jgi:hypothetical protein